MLQRILYSFLSKGTVALISFLVLLLSARYLGVRTRGEISIFLLNIALVQIVTEIYTGYSLVHFIPKYNNKKILGYGVFLILSFSLCCSLVLPQFFLLPPVSSVSYFNILSLVLTHTFFCVILLGKGQLKTFNLLSLLQPSWLLVLLAIQLFYSHLFTFDAYFQSICLSFIFSLPLSAAFALRHVSGIENEKEFQIIPVLGKGLFFQGTTLMIMFINRYNYYLLDETARVGLYATGCALMESLLLIANAATPVLLSKLSMHSANAPSFLRLIRFCLLFVLIPYIILWCVPEGVFIWLVGSGYIGIRAIMLAYGPSVIFQSACVLLGNYFVAKGLQKEVLKAYVLPFILVLIAAPIAIHYFGYMGAAFCAGFAFLLVFFSLYKRFCMLEGLSMKAFFLKFEWTNELHFLKKEF
jgi:O-antigen/teichoic acid export membrane protein